VAKPKRNEADDESPPSRAPGLPRLSLTLPVHVRKKLRLAAALADMTEGDWAKAVLVKAAKLTVEKHFPGKSS
jgi:hypothetical protein